MTIAGAGKKLLIRASINSCTPCPPMWHLCQYSVSIHFRITPLHNSSQYRRVGNRGGLVPKIDSD